MADIESDEEDVLHLIVESRNQKDGKSASKQVARRSNTAGEGPDILEGVDENLAKVIARRSHGVAMEDDDFGPIGNRIEGSATDVVQPAVDFDDTVPGAYSARPGHNHGRLMKGQLPSHLRGDATQRENSMTNRTLEETDHPLDPSFPIIEVSSGYKEMRAPGRRGYLIYWIVLAVFLTVTLATVLPLAIFLGGDEEEEASGMALDHSQPLDEVLLVPNLTQDTIRALEVPGSYQEFAYGWVKSNPEWENYEPWRKQQRFAIVCVYHALGGRSWRPRGSGGSGSTRRVTYAWLARTKPVTECDPTLRASDYEEFCVNDRLTVLDIGAEMIMNGVLPPELSLLPQLEVIDVGGSAVRGSDLEAVLPLNITLPNLKELIFSDCTLGGSIPSSLGLWTSLTKLDLSFNELSSTIPSQLGLLTQLRFLNLAGNNFIGSIPKKLRELTGLVSLRLDNNTGVEPFLPEGFCDGNHTSSIEHMSANWCWSIDQCCPP